MAEIRQVPTKKVKLGIETELRLLMGDESNVTVQLESGLAHIFGAEMTLDRVYKFPSNSSVSIFSWNGCSIRITDKPKAAYFVKETLMMLNVQLHAYLQERRNLAANQNTKGPVTLIVGPTDTGKSTLCRFLLNFAANMTPGQRPLFVDLDVGQNSISMPGTVGVLAIDKPADIILGHDTTAAKIYHFGYKSPSHNLILYFLLLKHLGNVIKLGLRFASPNVRASGVIINTCGWVRGHGYDAITHASMAFEINNLIVIGEERLYDELSRDMPSTVKVYFFPKMDGVVERSRMLRVKARESKIAEYFYGPLNQIRPYCIDMHFSEIKVYTVEPQPVGDDFDSKTVAMHHIKLQPVKLSVQLIDKVLALMKLDIDEVVTEDLALTEVIGFVSVRRVYLNTGGISLWSPQPRPLPSSILLLGDMRLVEQITD